MPGPIHTNCVSCCFAEKEGLTQVGCKAGRLDLFRALGEDIVVECECHDEQGRLHEFYVIDKNYCNFHRPESWLKDRADPVGDARREVTTKATILVYLGEGLSLAELAKTTESILSQTLPPFLVLFVNNQTEIPVKNLHAHLMCLIGNKITWRMNQVIERGGNGELLTKFAALDLVCNCLPNVHTSKKPCSTFYVLATPPWAFPANFLACLDAHQNDKLSKFRIVEGDEEGNGFVCQVFLHTHPSIGGFAEGIDRDGNKVWKIVDKVRLLSEEEGVDYLVATQEELMNATLSAGH